MRIRWGVVSAAIGIWALVLWFVLPAALGAIIPPEQYVRGPESSTWSVVIRDAVEGEDEPMLSDRVIVRDHTRDLQITIVGIDGDALGYYCDRSVMGLPAKARSAHPADMTLRRFMGEYRDPASKRSPPCKPRPPGTYSMSEAWIIHGPVGSRIRIDVPGVTFAVHEAGWQPEIIPGAGLTPPTTLSR